MDLGKAFAFGGIFVALMGILISGNISSPATMERLEHSPLKAFEERIMESSEDELYFMLDSLLEKDLIQPLVIESINERVRMLQSARSNSIYPANHIYHSWDTKKAHPYSEKLIAGDTTVKLVLTAYLEGKKFVNPFDGLVTSNFGWRKGRMHNGVDIGLLVGDTVRAAFDGVVRLAKWQGGYGRAVVIRHDNGLETIYGHLYRWMVKSGDRVKAGDPIARGGNSGASRGSHLHFETRFKGKAVNPACFIDFRNNRLKNDTLVLKKTKYGFLGHLPGGAFHKVKRGDFLFKIAQQYGTSVKEICEINGFRRNHFLVVGEEIKVSE